jgi:hypothetical protein
LNLKIVHSKIVANQVAERLEVEERAVQRYVDGSASLLERWLINRRKLSHYTSPPRCCATCRKSSVRGYARRWPSGFA